MFRIHIQFQDSSGHYVTVIYGHILQFTPVKQSFPDIYVLRAVSMGNYSEFLSFCIFPAVSLFTYNWMKKVTKNSLSPWVPTMAKVYKSFPA